MTKERLKSLYAFQYMSIDIEFILLSCALQSIDICWKNATSRLEIARDGGEGKTILCASVMYCGKT